jgi:thymidine kinase
MSKSGLLELIIGPMFSGKTTEIIALYRRYKSYNARVCVVNHVLDDRYDSKTDVKSHDGDKISSLQLDSIAKLISDEYLDLYDVFLINEGQFFPDLFQYTLQLVEFHKKKVHICGLDGDSNREPFGDILRLIPYADKIQKKSAFCKYCMDGTMAPFTKRIVKSNAKILVGTNDCYIPVCRNCYLNELLN